MPLPKENRDQVLISWGCRLVWTLSWQHAVQSVKALEQFVTRNRECSLLWLDPGWTIADES